jgi:hypothetical protein
MALQANVPNTRIFSIRNKLLLITGLFIFSFVMTELFETYVDTIVDTSIASMELRENQTASLKLLETTIVEFTLAGMDAVIDKGDGKIAEISEIAGDINSNSATVNTQSADLTQLAAQLNIIARQFMV